MKISKIKPREPSLKFFWKKIIEIVPQDINGIHRLAQFLLNRFVKAFFESTPKGKFEFINEILQDDLNKNMDIEDSIPALASAIISVYDIRKNIVNNELKGRDLKHVEYGIMKELENVWNMYSKRLFQLNNRTQKRYKQIKPIYLQKNRRVYLQDTFLTQA
jgi:hypothetical protein